MWFGLLALATRTLTSSPLSFLPVAFDADTEIDWVAYMQEVGGWAGGAGLHE